MTEHNESEAVEIPEFEDELPEEAHIAIDLETLGRSPGCVILTMGATVFNPDTGEVDEDSFYGVLNAREQIRAGSTVDPDTMAWWMDQPQAAQDEVLLSMRDMYTHQMTPVPGVLAAFADWCDGKAQRVVMWGNGPSFDNAILGALYDKVGLKKPWEFWNEGCMRTAVRMARSVGWEKPVHDGTAHHALHDSRHQARVICSALRYVKSMYNPPKAVVPEEHAHRPY